MHIVAYAIFKYFLISLNASEKNFTTFKNQITSKTYNNDKNLFLLLVVVVSKIKTNKVSLEIFCKYPCLCHTKLLLNIPYVKKTLLKRKWIESKHLLNNFAKCKVFSKYL